MLSRVEAQRRLAELARPQDGLVTVWQARSVDVPDRTFQRMGTRGELEHVHDGVMRFPAAAWSWRAKQRAALLAARDGACVSYAAAAHLLGIPNVPVGRPEITVSYSAPLALEGVRVHRSRDLPESDVTEIDGMRCTTGPRTVVDLSGVWERHRTIALVDDAIAAGAASRSRLLDRAHALRRGRAGVRTIIEVTQPGADGTFRSALERTFGERVREQGLPVPAYNVPLRHRGQLFVCDALWEPDLVGELHSLRFHDAPADRGRDDERLTAYAEMGLRTVVFGWRQVFTDFADVAAAINRALAGRVV